jgi:REP element-mobilizing transposase RayT
VVSRGNRQEAIFADDADRQTFLWLVGQTCGRTGWRVHAYVLMSNHYHLLLETPQSNLVAGMKWLQGVYTQRFNRCHGQCGHLFQGRYKALVVESGTAHYFSVVSTYIHLNPARAALFDLHRGRLEDYTWSSYPGYLQPDRRQQWLCVERVLGAYDLADDRRGRLEYRRFMEEQVAGIVSGDDCAEADQDRSRIRRGWYLGSESFVDSLLDRLDGIRSAKASGSLAGDAVDEHEERQAERLLEIGMMRLSLSSESLGVLAKGASEKRVLAWYVRSRTTVSNAWLAQRLSCGHPGNISGYIRSVEDGRSPRLRELKDRLLKSED